MISSQARVFIVYILESLGEFISPRLVKPDSVLLVATDTTMMASVGSSLVLKWAAGKKETRNMVLAQRKKIIDLRDAMGMPLSKNDVTPAQLPKQQPPLATY